MAFKLAPDLTGMQPFPVAADFIIPAPIENLGAIFKGSALATLDGAGGVVSWQDRIGNAATQAVSACRPLIAAGRIAPDGVNDFLRTALLPTVAGYICAKVLMKTVASGAIIFGSQTSPTQRLGFGISSSNQRLGATIGSKTVGTFNGGTGLVNNTEYVLGMSWSAGTVSLRVDGAEVLNGVYNAAGEGVGNLPMWIGALNFGGTANSPSPLHIKHLWKYTALPADIPAVDAALAAV